MNHESKFNTWLLDNAQKDQFTNCKLMENKFLTFLEQTNQIKSGT